MNVQAFHIRPPDAHELPAIEPWFADSVLGWKQCMIRVAFSRPEGVPLGAVIVRPALEGSVGTFTLYVRPDCRRRSIGRRLMERLYLLALCNNAEHLVMSELIHQNEPENAFCQALGMSPDMKLGTYELDLTRQVQPLCAPIAKRFLQSHPHLRGVRMMTLDHADAKAVGQFITNYHSGFVDQQTERARNGFYDRTLSVVSVRSDGSISGVGLFVAEPNNPKLLLDLVLTDPNMRNGPTPLVLFAEMTRRALAAGKTTVVFEADAQRDPFAVGFAERCGVNSPSCFRYRYAISREEMKKRCPENEQAPATHNAAGA